MALSSMMDEFLTILSIRRKRQQCSTHRIGTDSDSSVRYRPSSSVIYTISSSDFEHHRRTQMMSWSLNDDDDHHVYIDNCHVPNVNDHRPPGRSPTPSSSFTDHKHLDSHLTTSVIDRGSAFDGKRRVIEYARENNRNRSLNRYESGVQFPKTSNYADPIVVPKESGVQKSAFRTLPLSTKFHWNPIKDLDSRMPPPIPPPPNQDERSYRNSSLKPPLLQQMNPNEQNNRILRLALVGDNDNNGSSNSAQLRRPRPLCVTNDQRSNSQASSGYESISYPSSQESSSSCGGMKNVGSSGDEARQSIHSTSSSSGSSALTTISDGEPSDQIYLPPHQNGMSANDVLNRMLAKSVPDDDILAEWLNHVGFEQYLHLFVAAGYDLGTVARMTPEDLTAIGVTQPMHRKRMTADIHRLIISDCWPIIDETSSLADWLCQLGLPEYTRIFQNEGYNHVGQVTQLTWEDFEDFGIQKLGHLKKLEIAINKVKSSKEKLMIRKIQNRNDSSSIVNPGTARLKTFHNCPGSPGRIRNAHEKVLMIHSRTNSTNKYSQFTTAKNYKNSGGIDCSETFPRRNPTFGGHPFLILPNQSNNRQNNDEDLTDEDEDGLSKMFINQKLMMMSIPKAVPIPKPVPIPKVLSSSSSSLAEPECISLHSSSQYLQNFDSPPPISSDHVKQGGVQKWRPEPPMRAASSKSATGKLLRTKPFSVRNVGKRVSPPTMLSHFQQHPQETTAGNGPHLSGLESALNLSLDSCYGISPSASIDCIPPPPPAAVIRCEETIRNLRSLVDSRRRAAGLDPMRLRNSYSSESLTSLLLNCEGFNALNSSLTSTPNHPNDSTSMDLESLVGSNAADPSLLLLSMANKLQKTRGRSSSTETLPFANENCGTIKSTCHRGRCRHNETSASKTSSIVGSDDINFCEGNINPADNDNCSSSSLSTITTNSSTSSTSSSGGGGSSSSEGGSTAEELMPNANESLGSLNQLSPSSLLTHRKKSSLGSKGGPEVLNDIGNMLQNLTDELDAMLILPSTPSDQN